MIYLRPATQSPEDTAATLEAGGEIAGMVSIADQVQMAAWLRELVLLRAERARGKLKCHLFSLPEMAAELKKDPEAPVSIEGGASKAQLARWLDDWATNRVTLLKVEEALGTFRR